MASTEATAGHGIGAGLARREDLRLLRGRGRFLGDLPVARALQCRFVRADHAHARILSIGLDAALATPGVVAVLTGADLAADGIGPVRCSWRITAPDGTPMAEPDRAALARDAVRHVGEPVAMVLAETEAAAIEAADLVEVDCEALPAVTDARRALDGEAPLLHEAAPGNVCFRWERGDAAAVEAACAGAAHLVTVELTNNRLAGAAIEPRAAIADFDADSGILTLHSTTQTPHMIRRLVAAELGMEEGRVRVVSPDVGGGFGYKGKHYPEELAVAWAARRLGRPVRWIGGRTEGFLSDTQARDHATTATLALDADGHFLALKVDTVANVGAWVSSYGAAIPSAIYSALLAGVYRTPAIHVAVTGAFTNTVPTDAYRGAGRPEACYVLERLVDRAARTLGVDRAELRRRNMIPASAMPYTTPIGPTYDSGDFPRLLDRVCALSAYADFEARRAESARAGRLRGIGLACYIESSGVAPSRMAGSLGADGGFFESAEIRVDPSGGITAMLGTHNHGQGHETSFAQIIGSALGVPPDRVTIVEGDTALVPHGTGTFGSRSIAVGGSALVRASEKILAKGRLIAAQLLEAPAADIGFEDGRFTVAGTDRAVTFEEVARAAHTPHLLGDAVMEPGLHETAFYDPGNFAWSNGAHACELEVDPETGVVRLLGYWAVDDMGTVINPVIVEGQVQGGLAQGIGQALLETCVYDPESGQPLAASFLDYAMPRADDLIDFTCEHDETQPCVHNPLGAKGCGEAGTIGAPAAVVSALLDALGPAGVADIEMPATPGRLWQAIRAARG